MLDLRPLRLASFRSLALGYWVNEFGNWIGEIALTILTYDHTRSPLATAAFFLSVRFLPALVAPLTTARIEILPARIALPALYVFEAIFFACLALLAHHFSLPAIFALGALDAVLAITAKALTRGATSKALTEVGLLRQGNAILNLGVVTATAGSPVIAGVVVASSGASTALVIDAISFVATAAIVGCASGLTFAGSDEARFRQRAEAGLVALRRQMSVRRLMNINALFWIFGSIAIPVEVVFAKRTLHAGDAGYGLLLAAWGAGTVIGGIGFATLSRLRLSRLLGIGLGMVAIGYCGIAVSPSLLAACALSVLGGVGNGCGWVSLVTAIQERVPNDSQNAVMAIFEATTQLMPAIGFIAGGAMATLGSPRLAYAASAIGVAVVAASLGVRPIDRVRLSAVGALAPNTAVDYRPAQENEVSERTHQVRSLTLG